MSAKKNTTAKAVKENKSANVNVVNESKTNERAIVDSNVPNVDAAKAAEKHNAALIQAATKATLLAKQALQSDAAWARTFKCELRKVDAELAAQVEARWSEYIVAFKMALNHVVVNVKRPIYDSSKKKIGEELVACVKPVMWVRKTDKVGLPNYFEKSAAVSYRINDKKGNGDEVTISDGKELVVKRLVPVARKIQATDVAGNTYEVAQKIKSSDGKWVVAYDEQEQEFVPLEQLTFDFNEVKHAFGRALVALFGK